jgi:cation:H+ antiporter
MLFLWILVLILSIAVLFKSSDYFTDAAETIGLFFRLPTFIIGVTIVAIGTSLPELVSSVLAVLEGSSEIVSGNVVGSNITNIFLILGLVAVFSRKMKFDYEIISVDLPVLMSSAFLLALLTMDGEFTLGEALLSLLGAIIFLFHTARGRKKSSAAVKGTEQELKKELREEFKVKRNKFPWKEAGVVLASGFFVFLSAKYTIESVLKISDFLTIGKEIIAASAVALGTSLPELGVSLTAVKKGNSAVAIGGILGSNIFNSLGVMGLVGLFGSLAIPSSIIGFGLPLMLIATLLYLFITQDKEVTRWEGGFLILFYLFYLGKLFNWI